MELRRALLLFAIVLGLAAIVTSVSQPSEDDRGKKSSAPPAAAPSTPTATGQERAARPQRIRFDAAGRTRRERVQVGKAATVLVSVDRPGHVQLEGLGLSSAAEALTPARFDVLASRPGDHPVRFTPAGTREARKVGLLEIEPPR